MNVQWLLAWRYLLGRRQRMVLTTLAVVCGVSIIFGLNSMIQPVVNAYRKNILVSAGVVDLTITNSASGSFDPAILADVRSTAGVAAASGLLRHAVVLPAAQSSAAADKLSSLGSVTISGLEPADAQEVRSYPIVAGRFLEAGDMDAAVISESLALNLGLQVGDTLSLPSAQGAQDLQIVGLLTPPLTGGSEVYVALPMAQAMFNEAGKINTVEALYAGNVDHTRVESQILEKIGPNYQLGIADTSEGLLSSLKLGEVAITLIGVLALAMAGFIIFNTFRTVIVERRHDLGVLRAVGASRRTVLGLILIESLIQGILGTALGLLAGYLLASGMLLAVRPIMDQFLHLGIGGPQFTWNTLILSVVLGIGFTVFSGLLPAFSAMKVTPLEALRPQPAATYEASAGRQAIAGAILLVLSALGLLSGIFQLQSLSSLTFVLSLVLVAPALAFPLSRGFGRLLKVFMPEEGRLAEVNLARQPNRAGVTASAMMIGLAVVVALLGMMTSLRSSFTGYMDSSLRADYLIMPFSLVLNGGNMAAGPQLAQDIQAIDGISDFASIRLATSRADGVDIQVLGIDPLAYPRVSGMEFSQGVAAQAYPALAAGRAIIINGIFASQNNVKVGDTLQMQTLSGEQPYTVVGIGIDILNAKLSTGYISQTNLAEDFGQTSDVLLMADRAAGADAAQVDQAVKQLVAQYPAFSLVNAAEFRQTTMQSFDAALIMMYMLTMLLAIPALIAMINTLSISVLERTREIGMLRAVGATRKQVQRIVLGESLLLAALGIALGVLAGIWLGYVLIQTLNVSGFPMAYAFPFGGILDAIVIGLIFGLLAASIPSRQATHMEIVAALRYE
jgi:putative ABC transport system permease protein